MNFDDLEKAMRSDCIKVSRVLMSRMGIMPASFLAYLIDLREKRMTEGDIDKDGYFLIPIIEIEQDFYLKSDTQLRLLKLLKKNEFIDFKRMGLPCRRYCCVFIDKVEKVSGQTIKRNTKKRIPYFEDPYKEYDRLISNNTKNKIKRLSKMPYIIFLKTGYWKSIRRIVIELLNGKCSICGNKRNIHIHHFNYKHHGNEIEYLEDLTCLCRECHQKIHNIKDNK